MRTCTGALLVLFLLAGAQPARAQEPPQQEQSEQTRQRADDKEPVDRPSDGRRTIARLPANFGRGIVGILAPESLLPLLVGTTVTGGAAVLDSEVSSPNGEDDSLGKFGQGFGNPVIVAMTATGMLLAGRMNNGPRFRAASYDVFVAAGVNLLYTKALKLAVDRTRPNGENDDSFPSGHASNAFAWATVLQHHYGSKVGIPMYALASVVGVSRVSKGKHHLSDVVAGATLGLLVGLSVTRENGVPIGGLNVELSPTVGPSGQPGVLARIQF